MPRAVNFYLRNEVDPLCGSIEDVWLFNPSKLESIHSYIQRIFPTMRPSDYNPGAPILTAEDIEIFRAHPELRQDVLHSLRIMLNFYGLTLNESNETPAITMDIATFQTRRRIWLTKGNHNFLRLTRIIDSLRLLGLGQYGRALFNCLDTIYQCNAEIISSKTYGFWHEAAQGIQEEDCLEICPVVPDKAFVDELNIDLENIKAIAYSVLYDEYVRSSNIRQGMQNFFGSRVATRRKALSAILQMQQINSLSELRNINAIIRLHWTNKSGKNRYPGCQAIYDELIALRNKLQVQYEPVNVLQPVR